MGIILVLCSKSLLRIYFLYESESEVAPSCRTLCNSMDCSLTGSSSVHGIFQARILEWVAISFSRRSSPPRNRARVSHIVGTRFTIWATREIYFLYSSLYLPISNLNLSLLLLALFKTTSFFLCYICLLILFIDLFVLFLDGTYNGHYIAFVFLWQMLSVIFSKFIYVSANANISLFYMAQ